MNEQAANRMLKTLEEPPAFAHLLLSSDRREDVLATIVSRCQRVRFDPLPSSAIAARARSAEACDGRARAAHARAWRWATRASRRGSTSEEGAALRARR